MTDKKRFSNIRDVAELANVSTATVSRVINNTGTVTEATKARVLEAIRQCGYTPNAAVSTVFSGTSKTIAFFVLDISNPFYVSFIRHLNRIALDSNYNLIICETEYSLEKERKYYEYCKSIRACGIIYTAGTSRKYFELDQTSSIPIVLLDRMSFLDLPAYSVHSNNDKALKLLVNYLYHLGHRRIGYIGGVRSSLSGQERYTAFLKYMKEHGLPVAEDHVLFDSFSEESGMNAFDHFTSLPSPPTAVIAASDQIARGFIMRANSLGSSIPNDFSICGIDGVDEQFYPKITSIRQNVEKLAQYAFDYIVKAGENPPPSKKVLDVSLALGQTCRKLSVSD